MPEENGRIIDLVPYLNLPFGRKYRGGLVGLSNIRSKVYHTYKDCSKLGSDPIVLKLKDLEKLGYQLTKCKECERHERQGRKSEELPGKL